MRQESFLQWTSLYKDVFIFGAGLYGKAIRNFLLKHNVCVSGFVVSEIESMSAETDNLVVDINEFGRDYYCDSTGLILAVDCRYYNEVVPKLSFALGNSFFLEDGFKRACLEVYGDSEKSDILYDEEFFEYILNSQRASADALVQAITFFIKPETVIDVGCGLGLIANKFYEYGAREVFGVDGDYIDRSKLQLDKSRFIPHDLTKPFISHRRYDLALSLEVAEHLEGVYAPQFIETLCRLSDNIVFSAAVCGQGGTHHVNEQPQSYWVRLFKENGYKAIDCIRPLIWDDNRIDYYYRQNTFLLVNSEKTDHDYFQEPIFDVIHPELLKRHHRYEMKPSKKAYDKWRYMKKYE